MCTVCLSVFRWPALLGYCLFWQPATLFCCLLALANKDCLLDWLIDLCERLNTRARTHTQVQVFIRLRGRRQIGQLSQRDRASEWVSFGQQWKTGTGRQYLADITGLSSTTVTQLASKAIEVGEKRQNKAYGLFNACAVRIVSK